MNNHQFNLFAYKEGLKTKVPISEARIREVKKLIEEQKGKEAAAVLREVRYGLENYLKRLK